MSAPGPGRPLVVLTVFDVVAGMQKSDTTVPVDVFGNVGSFHGGLTGMGTPVRSIFPALAGFPVLVGKHALVGSPAQQNWLSPPFASMHLLSAGFVWQASPVHVALHA